MMTPGSYSEVGCRGLLENFGSFYNVTRNLHPEDREGNYMHIPK
jgi:hypothetical protein